MRQCQLNTSVFVVTQKYNHLLTFHKFEKVRRWAHAEERRRGTLASIIIIIILTLSYHRIITPYCTLRYYMKRHGAKRARPARGVCVCSDLVPLSGLRADSKRSQRIQSSVRMGGPCAHCARVSPYIIIICDVPTIWLPVSPCIMYNMKNQRKRAVRSVVRRKIWSVRCFNEKNNNNIAFKHLGRVLGIRRNIDHQLTASIHRESVVPYWRVHTSVSEETNCKI